MGLPRQGLRRQRLRRRPKQEWDRPAERHHFPLGQI